MQTTLKRASHRQIRWDNIMLLALVVSLLIGVLFVVASWNDTPNIVSSKPYTVQYGDTLWEIAEQSNGYGNMDIRDIIYDIQRLSDCTTEINNGQIVQIPIYEED